MVTIFLKLAKKHLIKNHNYIDFKNINDMNLSNIIDYVSANLR
jgi:hypothetical protein